MTGCGNQNTGGQTAGRSLAARRGFTLVEMIVVTAIIGLLAAMLMGALALARNAAKKAKARSEVQQVRAAWETFFQDYARLPQADLLGMVGPDAIRILNASSNAVAVAENPRRIVYMNFRPQTTHFVDPWGTPNTISGVYRLALDTDYDNKLTIHGEDVYASVAVWSTGPDGVDGTDDDIVSWKR